eukprot:snap_masked-scaffold_57-processed-gene-0.7-mRNA-1 protein AED:1.00 eAED:1.00 QI:0/-1/0/0/-1/1/1/0/362
MQHTQVTSLYSSLPKIVGRSYRFQMVLRDQYNNTIHRNSILDLSMQFFGRRGRNDHTFYGFNSTSWIYSAYYVQTQVGNWSLQIYKSCDQDPMCILLYKNDIFFIHAISGLPYSYTNSSKSDIVQVGSRYSFAIYLHDDFGNPVWEPDRGLNFSIVFDKKAVLPGSECGYHSSNILTCSFIPIIVGNERLRFKIIPSNVSAVDFEKVSVDYMINRTVYEIGLVDSARSMNESHVKYYPLNTTAGEKGNLNFVSRDMFGNLNVHHKSTTTPFNVWVVHVKTLERTEYSSIFNTNSGLHKIEFVLNITGMYTIDAGFAEGSFTKEIFLSRFAPSMSQLLPHNTAFTAYESYEVKARLKITLVTT